MGTLPGTGNGADLTKIYLSFSFRSWYLELLEKYTKDLEEDNDEYTRVAFQVYLDIMTERRKRKR